jgi:hypothetical protein
MFFEYIHDFDRGDNERITGYLKPTKFAKFIDRICIGKMPSL